MKVINKNDNNLFTTSNSFVISTKKQISSLFLICTIFSSLFFIASVVCFILYGTNNQSEQFKDILIPAIILAIICFLIILIFGIIIKLLKSKLQIIENEEYIKRQEELKELAKMELYNNNEKYRTYINTINKIN